jgi:hypothetical protein
MSDLAGKTIPFEEIYPGSGPHGLNTCFNPDCRSYGVPPIDRKAFFKKLREANATVEEMDAALAKQAGLYSIHAGEDTHRRESSAFLYKNNPSIWVDRRKLRCDTRVPGGQACKTSSIILSEAHLEEEIARLRNANGVLDGAACGGCGKRYLDAPEEFSLHGTHARTKDNDGNRIKPPARPEAVRVIHKPCRGKKKARFTISAAHRRQRETKDNLRIMLNLNNSAGVLDIQRVLGPEAAGRKIGIGRIYDRILWLEEVMLAYEREMLRRWRKKMEARARAGKDVVHRLSHDDMTINVNWETASDRRHTQLNCAITADATSGYVYRMDVDFDPRVEPLRVFRASYLSPKGRLKNLRRRYKVGTSDAFTLPLMAFQRPTGRLHEPQFFAACVKELQVFLKKLRRRHPRSTPAEIAAYEAIKERAKRDIRALETVGTGWFGFKDTSTEIRGSSKGMTTFDTYTKAAHLALVRDTLPPGKIILTTEQEATIHSIAPHIFREEIKDNRFTWLAMIFDKKATKPERNAKLAAYRDAWQDFREAGLYSGRFTQRTSDEEITLAFIADKMTAAKSGRAGHHGPFASGAYASRAFPKLWIESPAQSNGEIDKVVGFPVVPAYLRYRLKKLPFDAKLDPDIREDLAEHVWSATLQPASSFMNSVRQRLESAARTERGGARSGGTYRPGAVFNPRVLIAIVNIFRIHYNFFEMRTYESELKPEEDHQNSPARRPRGLRYPGTNEIIPSIKKPRRVPVERTPAMRHGMDAFIIRKEEIKTKPKTTKTKTKTVKDDPLIESEGNAAVQLPAEAASKPVVKTRKVIYPPDIHRVLYRPWLYMGTPVGTKLDE